MTESRQFRRVTVRNPQGLHMRAADRFSTAARQFQSQVEVAKGEQRVDGSSMRDILLLVAEQGTELELEVIGPDATEAIEALARLCKTI